MGIRIERATVDLHEVQIALKEFENTFGVPSARMVEAFTGADGRFRESAEWREWDFLFDLFHSFCPAAS